MKVIKNFKALMIIAVLATVISSCGQSTQSILGGSQYYAGTCTAGTTDKTFTGTIADSQGSSGYGVVTGNVQLSIISAGGVVAGQYSASAVLTLNGTQYCCTTQGVGNVLSAPTASDEVAIVNGLTLICNSNGASSGLFGGSYQAITLKIGVPVQGVSPGYAQGNAYLLVDKTMQGFVSITSGVQVVGGIGNSGIYFVQ